MTSPEKAALFVGPLKPTVSRLAVSRVWARAPRPGPAEYTLQGSLGTQPLSKQPSSTGFAFGKESREGYNTNPSPSDQFLFDAEKSMGTQVSSKRVTSPRAHMGTGTRDSATATYNVHTYKPH